MPTLAELRAGLSEETRDLRLNLESVLRADRLDRTQTYAVALASALFLDGRRLAEAIRDEARDVLTPEVVADAKASAAIMAMNTVYYRFRHMVGKESYQQKPAGLRMNRMVKPATSKALFELCSMACAALAGCEACIQAHEASLLKEGLTEDQVHEAVRIAAVVNGFRIAAAESDFLAVPTA
jgi:alkyl hydroperoxide reductase subunit D